LELTANPSVLGSSFSRLILSWEPTGSRIWRGTYLSFWERLEAKLIRDSLTLRRDYYYSPLLKESLPLAEGGGGSIKSLSIVSVLISIFCFYVFSEGINLRFGLWACKVLFLFFSLGIEGLSTFLLTQSP
jgi:hypothetical protein